MTSGFVAPGTTINFYVRFISQSTGRGVTGLTVTGAVNRDAANVVNGVTWTEVDAANQPGLYTYQLAGGSTGTLGTYVAYAVTADLTVVGQSATVACEVGYAPANMNALADAILDRDMGAGVDSGGRTVRNALRLLRNKVTLALNVLTVTKEDDTTPAWTAAITTDNTAQPIVGIDP